MPETHMEPITPATAPNPAPAPATALAVCASDALSDGGLAVRHDALFYGRPASVFFVRFRGTVQGYLNQCAHVPAEMDWVEGQFFESSGQYLMCAMHGAIYEPDTGRCVGGPCRGGRLRALQVEERDTASGRQVFWLPDAHITPVNPVSQPSTPQAPDHVRPTDA